MQIDAQFGLIGGAVSPFVGRDRELRTLRDTLDRVIGARPLPEPRPSTTGIAPAKEGEVAVRPRVHGARVVTVLGAGGAGKTRLVHEFLERTTSRREESATPEFRVFRTLARGTDPAYGLFGRLLRDRFGLTDAMTPEEVAAAVRNQVAEVVGDRRVGDVVYFLGQFLETPIAPSPLTRAISDDPVEAKLLRRTVVRSFIESDAQHGPICLIFDDLDEAHAESIELLRYLISCLSGPILIVCCARPAFLGAAEDWSFAGEGHHQVLDLSPLTPEESSELLSGLLAPAADERGVIAPALIQNAGQFAGGSPLLIEQMVRLYHDRGVLEDAAGADGQPRWAVRLDALAKAELPLTVEDAIQARVRALSDHERKLLELASIIGAVFWDTALRPLDRAGAEAPDDWGFGGPSESDSVSQRLAELEAKDFILRLPDSSIPGAVEFAFKHNMEREALRSRVPAALGKRLHGVFADWLDQQGHAKVGEESQLLLAFHREKAGDHLAAGVAYLAAGDASRAAYAASTACSHYERGLLLLGEACVGHRIDALHNYGDVLLLTGRIDDALASFREMLTLAFRLDIRAKGGAAHNRIGRLYRDTGALDDAHRHLEAALNLFSAAKDERGVASTIDDLGKLDWLRGEYISALARLREGLARRRKLGDRRSIALSFNNLGIVLQETGEFGQAVSSFEQALQIRREIGDLPGVVATLNNLGTIHQDRAEFQTALRLFEEALDVAKQVGDRNRVARVLVNVGDTLSRAGDLPKAISVLQAAEEQLDEVGDKLGLADALRALGDAYLYRGELVKARECIGRCVDLFATVRSKVQLGTALRTLGEITAAGGWGPTHTRSAREYFSRSADIFEQTGNELELARTQLSFAKFLRAEEPTQPGARQEADRMEHAGRQVVARLLGQRDTRPPVPAVSSEPADEL